MTLRGGDTFSAVNERGRGDIFFSSTLIAVHYYNLPTADNLAIIAK